MPALNPPHSSAVVDVPEGSVDHYLEQGWTKVQDDKNEAPAKRAPKSKK